MSVIDRDLIGHSRKAYFIGIGGVGMSALARVLQWRGLAVSGSDARESLRTRELELAGIPVRIGQQDVGFEDPDLVVYSSAIRPDHLELRAARAQGRKVHHRAEILSSLFNQAATSVAVTGTHGKTTTSSMISFLLAELGRDPTCLVGGDVLNLGTNTRLGNPNLWVSEVDESDQTHEFYAPHYAVLTNLEEDHMDHYRDLEAIRESFATFVANGRDPGLIVYCADDRMLSELVRKSGRPAVGYGLDPAADFAALHIEEKDYGSEFDLMESGFFVTRIRLGVPGLHNVTNALAACALCLHMGLDPHDIAKVMPHFRGARRRLEIKWEAEDLLVVDDYAHHPTELAASIRALRNRSRHLTLIFQPHRYSRTRHFYKAFGRAFEGVDELILTDIYGAGESNPEDVRSEWIYDQVISNGHPHARVLKKEDILPYLLGQSDLRGTVAFVGAGDIGEIADAYADRLKSLAQA